MLTPEPDTVRGTRLVTVLDGLTDPAAALGLVASAPSYRDVDGISTRLETLRERHACGQLSGTTRDALLRLLRPGALPGPPDSLAVHRYEEHGYALPHRLSERTAPAEDGPDWVALCALTTSGTDGFTVWDGLRFVRMTDRAGRLLILPPDTWCWSGPVVRGPRHTLTIGGRHA